MSDEMNQTRRAILAGGAAVAVSVAATAATANSLNSSSAPIQLNPNGRFVGKVIAVTGGNSGIGAATVRAFAMEGGQVVFGARRDELGRQLEVALRDAGGAVTWVQTDVRDPAQVERFITAAT
ncbi:SDR family NAD(P)-dependent oxidoreductase [Sulfitobacter sp. 1151]|uniref:SDR family NAD(P)-dependent oxidoreductase n=1 Tax=Parasulfitobacter algicola TaxID=2614809 RepID=A0ABX2IWM4_9RHOB|nr:SDR family NAD(P)-dependent oxidoreductase [Sulfitobacter algicola]